jgi:hypothetical protein
MISICCIKLLYFLNYNKKKTTNKSSTHVLFIWHLKVDSSNMMVFVMIFYKHKADSLSIFVFIKSCIFSLFFFFFFYLKKYKDIGCFSHSLSFFFIKINIKQNSCNIFKAKFKSKLFIKF